jgi:hypothetical protein
MSESEQDALLDKIESDRRWRVIRARSIGALFYVAALASGAALVIALKLLP